MPFFKPDALLGARAKVLRLRTSELTNAMASSDKMLRFLIFSRVLCVLTAIPISELDYEDYYSDEGEYQDHYNDFRVQPFLQVDTTNATTTTNTTTSSTTTPGKQLDLELSSTN